ncbi:MAG: cysteine desulfurase, partial [Rickettsia endosymbiont of Ixodes persulcatus]|nr:cysteine desulfurase [Rickettsia endosymbiont of Ixodes persulcatus]
CVSSGSACSSGKISKSHVLTNMGVEEEEAKSSIRVSLSHNRD